MHRRRHARRINPAAQAAPGNPTNPMGLLLTGGPAVPVTNPKPTFPIDRYTVGSASIGVLMGLGKFPWWLALPLGIAFQFSRSRVGAFVPGAFQHPQGESVTHDGVDLAAMLGAWLIFRSLPPHPNAPDAMGPCPVGCMPSPNE